MWSKFKETEHEGFATTLEVIVTLAIMTTFLCLTLYILEVMNVQRYMNTVLTSTAAQAARWGGVNSNAYRNNVSSTPLITSAQNQLNSVASDYGAIITGGPNKITNNNQKITLRISYQLPNAFHSISKVTSPDGSQYDMWEKTKNMSMQVSVNSIMEAGKLL